MAARPVLKPAYKHNIERARAAFLESDIVRRHVAGPEKRLATMVLNERRHQLSRAFHRWSY